MVILKQMFILDTFIVLKTDVLELTVDIYISA